MTVVDRTLIRRGAPFGAGGRRHLHVAKYLDRRQISRMASQTAARVGARVLVVVDIDGTDRLDRREGHENK